VAVAWSYYRYGYSPAAPGSFAREVLDPLPDGVALLHLDGRLHYANGWMLALLGARHEELASDVGALLSCPILPPEPDLREVECELTTPAGPVPVAVSTSRLHDKLGLTLAVVLVMRDLREVRSLRSRLVTAGRLAAIGQLAAGIAHEINNPTAYVRSNLSQLREAWLELAKAARGERGPERLQALLALGEELIDESLEGVERTAAIVRNVRGFAHGGGGQPEPVDPNRLVEEVLRMAQPQLRDGVTIESRLSDVPRISGVPQELRQVLLNLVVNAIQAMDRTGSVAVTTLREGARVLVRVEDDGRGIAPDDLERIFDPFFTTKAVGEGTGLGLAISYQIVRAHEAELLVDSQPGRGSRFTLRFPELVSPSSPGSG
jgi:signal transduction histidine kinase